MAECLLRKANGRPDALCDEHACAFWRVVDHLGVSVDADWSGCAIQHFALLEGGEELAAWLLSAKERAAAAAAERDSAEPARSGWTCATTDTGHSTVETQLS